MPYLPMLLCDGPQCGAQTVVQNNTPPPTWLCLSPGGWFCSYDCVAEHCLAAITEIKAMQAERDAHAAEAEPVGASRPT